MPEESEESIGFSYDLAGRRTEMSDGTGTTSYSYNKSTGILNTQTYPDGKTIDYDYDAVGNRFMMNDPFGSNTYYHYDSSNRLDVVAPSSDFLNNSNTSDYYAKYNYFSNSLLKKITQKNGVTSEFIYDGLRIGSLTEKKSDNTVINVFSYTYDNNGNQDTRTEQQGSNPAVTNNFHYDPLNRISTSDQFNESYGYDNRGNRTTMSTSNPVERPDSTMTFDKRDRLTNVTLTSGGNVSYKYNGDGLLWERTENGLTTRYYWDGDQVIAEANVISGVTTLKARYIRGQGLISREDNKSKAYYLQNGHGDVVNLMDSTGTTKLNSYQYDIFGNIVSQQENLPQPFKYSGEMMDDKVGLQYLRARWYDPSIGRFVGEDTFGGSVTNPLSQNRFTYVYNNPLTNVDPTGHWCTASVGDKTYSHPGGCNDGSGDQDGGRTNGSGYTKDEIHNGEYYYDDNGQLKQYFNKGAPHISDPSGISQTVVGCATDSQCAGFVTGGVASSGATIANGARAGWGLVTTGARKAWEYFFGNKKDSAPEIEWPPNMGFDGEAETTTLSPGTLVDRYGYEGGSFVSPQGTPFAQRALPASYESDKPYHVYEVVNSLEVKSGRIAPWFGQPGGGTQYLLPNSVKDLIESGVLREVK
ncbi:glycohydrolase toxin TNT-related protein [Paenibacillus aestuarii]|uniref:Glycohydrolase toxin TNT-related protein n=1 Tax=Paenibacillus aestuarii TaxID=516965 RepID=A0ABW0K1R8_9BACL|nr:glycohydrolase toxin TNT-related protein [Paenibacillus aestuarii]